MAASYVGGAYFRKGNREKAIELYERSEDIGSLISLKAWDYVEKASKYDDHRVQELEYIFNRFPNSPLLSIKLQGFVRERESFVYDYEDWAERGFHDPVNVRTERVGDSLVAVDDREFYDELKKFASQVVQKRECKQKNMWFYALAFLAYLDGDGATARNYVYKAQKSPDSQLLQNSVNVLRILLDASEAKNNKAYLSRLERDLKWIDSQLVDESCAWHNWQYANKLNWSVNYWQDVIRRILLGEIIPRLEKSGNSVTALQLANYASNRLIQLSSLIETFHYNGKDEPYSKVMTFDEYRNTWPDRNEYDYSNQFFDLITSMSAKEAAEYAERVVNPKSELDRFLDQRGYTDVDYIFEIVGTLYLREMNYSKAIRWLSKVSFNYQSRTNLAKEGYFKLDPFSFQGDKKKFINDSEDYKLRFAQEMAQLERIIYSNADADRKANAKIRYATGLRNSFGRCWYLTQYGFNVEYASDSDGAWEVYQSDDRRGFRGNLYAQKAYKKVDELMEQALEEFTDMEQAAKAQLAIMNFKSLLEKYPETKAAASVRGRCDNYYDYALQKL